MSEVSADCERVGEPLRISFIVPCYNYGRFLADCVESIRQQEGDWAYEILIIDDASTDDTQEVIGTFLPDPRIRVITHERNQGHARTVNEGLRAARGELIARIDPDDRYRPGFLSRMVPVFAVHPEVGLVYGDAAIIDAQGRVQVASCDCVHGGRDFKGSEFIPLLEKNFICAPTMIARREAWLSVPPVPEWLAFNDWYFTLFMARNWDSFYIDAVLAEYRVHTSNHHSLIARNKTEERSIFWLLDQFYLSPERNPDLEQKKRRRKRRIYAAHYRDCGLKYFGFRHYEDARRCLLRALALNPRQLADLELLRLLAATMIGPRRYERLRTWLRLVLAR